MSNKQQTGVDWLYEELLAQFHLQIDSFIAHELKGKLNQAKEMEKEQIIDAYAQGFIESESMDKGAEQYYKETYGE
jgi:hypothetical protein